MLKEDTPIVELTLEQIELVSGGKYGGKGTTEGHGTRGVGARDTSGPVGGKGGDKRAVGDPPKSKVQSGSKLSCTVGAPDKGWGLMGKCKLSF
ncbi:MAG: hypothetical protein IPK59_08195 [Rhodospirillaceae bacterium]|nr:hypothetical protein [Rhodospirillaceae bacterium]